MEYKTLGNVDMVRLEIEARKVADRMSLTFEESAGGYNIKNRDGTRTLASLSPDGFKMDTVNGYQSLMFSLETAYIRSAGVNRPIR